MDTDITLSTQIGLDFVWQVDWEAKWHFAWDTEVYGPIGYTEPASTRVHIYTQGIDGKPVSHTVYNFMGSEGQVPIFAGIHDVLFHNNDSEYLLFRTDEESSEIFAYTRVISKGLQSSTPTMTMAQKASAYQAELDDEDVPDDDPVAFAPDGLFSLYSKDVVVSDNPDDYEYIDGRYVVKIEGEMEPSTFIYLFEIRLNNNNGRVIGSQAAALTGVAGGVNLNTGITSSTIVSIPMEVYLNNEADQDLLGARVMTFGIPGCNPFDPESVAQAPQTRHYLVVNVRYNNGGSRNIRIDVTRDLRACPTGGVIDLAVDVDDFPPTPPEPHQTGGFEALVSEWDEEVGEIEIKR